MGVVPEDGGSYPVVEHALQRVSEGLVIFSGRYIWPLPHTGPHSNGREYQLSGFGR